MAWVCQACPGRLALKETAALWDTQANLASQVIKESLGCQGPLENQEDQDGQVSRVYRGPPGHWGRRASRVWTASLDL